jgi:electron transport complex protein RnfG
VTAPDVQSGPAAQVDSAVPAPVPASALRMVLTLGSAGAIAGLLIVGVFDATFETIEAHKAEVLRRAVAEVLGAQASYEVRYVTDDGAVRERPEADPETSAETIYVGRDAEGRATGFAALAAEPGFQDVIALVYGFDPRSGRLLGMKVLESKETPGLGDKIEKDREFVAQFRGREPPLRAVKRATGAPGEIDAISGATISSRAVVRIINRSLGRVRAPMEAHLIEAHLEAPLEAYVEAQDGDSP